MQPVPHELLERLRKVAPPEAETIPLSWAYETEDYNIAYGLYGLASTGEGPCGGLLTCCENCWDFDGKMRGTRGHPGKDSQAGYCKKIRGVAAFSRRCHSPSGWTRSPCHPCRDARRLALALPSSLPEAR